MNKIIKKWTAGASLVAVLSLAALPAYADTDIASTDLRLVVNDKVVETNEDIGQPFITSDGRTMIPLRLVSEEFGYKTDWQEDGTIHITSDDGSVDVKFTLGTDNYLANGKPGVFNTRPTLINDRTYLPARDFMELYGVVKWDDATRTVTITTGSQPAEETSDWTFKMGFGGDIETITHLYVVATNEKTGKVVYLTGLEDVYGDWSEDSAHYADFYLNNAKRINGQQTITVGRQSAMANAEVSLFFVPDLDTAGTTAALTYVCDFNYSTDYTIANGYLYYTQGTKGPFVYDENMLYFYKIGDDTRDCVSFELDFPVNRCTLTVEDGTLVATEKDGTHHNVLQVPEADSVDIAHMMSALADNDTDALTDEEIACMPTSTANAE